LVRGIPVQTNNRLIGKEEKLLIKQPRKQLPGDQGSQALEKFVRSWAGLKDLAQLAAYLLDPLSDKCNLAPESASTELRFSKQGRLNNRTAEIEQSFRQVHDPYFA
jgi:hypothetical protein